MPRFVYKVRNKQGKIVETTQDAVSEDELIRQLQKDGLVVISIGSAEKSTERRVYGLHYHQRVTIDDLVVFSRQMATVLEAGVTLLRSLDVLSRQIESRRLLQAVEDIKHNVAHGSSLRDALVRHPKIFSEFWVHMVETGEASGALPLAFKQLADYLENISSIRRKLTSALIYPSVLILLVSAALVILNLKIIPMFSKIFQNFKVDLPFLTLLVLKMSDFMRRYFILIFGSICGLGFLGYRYMQTQQGKHQFDRLILRIPVLSVLFQQIAIERFATALGTLIESGVPILYALDIVSKGVGNRVVEKAINEVRESVRQGKGMAYPMEKSGVFTPLSVQMIAVGEEIGELGKMLKRISEFYRERISTTLTRIAALIEPMILIFMGIIVGGIVVSIFLPIFQLVSLPQGG